MAKKKNNDDQKLEEIRQDFNEIIDELKKEVEELKKTILSLSRQVRQVERENMASQKTAMVVWEKTSGTLGEITKRISDMAKPINYKKDR